MKAKTILIAMTLLALVGAGAAYANHQEGPDWTTTLKVKVELLTKLGADAVHIDVDTVAGKVTLSGTVEKRATKELAGDVAKSVEGVKSVDNDLRLESAVRNGKTAEAAVSEAEKEVKDGLLESRVRLALIDKLGTDGFRVGTEAASGVLTLEFDKSMTAERRKEAVKVTEGVEGVSKVITVDKQP